jgi:hypothetical protein
VTASATATRPFGDLPVAASLETQFRGRRSLTCRARGELQNGEVAAVTPTDEIHTVEKVGRVLSGISLIGEARNALEMAGWRATIAANRVTVNEEVLAQLIPATAGSFGAVDAYWVIYAIAGRRPGWIVGAEGPRDRDSSTGGGVDVPR